MKEFPIGDGVMLPIAAAMARYIALGKSGAGKTNGDAVMIEGFVRGGIPTICADPLGQMRGLRAGREDGYTGLPIAILGGEHGDLPLPFDRAHYIADMLGEGVSAVLDLSLIDAEQHEEFMRMFLPRLLQRAIAQGVLMHVNFQEADRFAPERNSKPTPVTRWARAARNAGMGWSFSTHKPQVIDKAILETANCFIAYRMTGELAQEAIGAQLGSLIGKKTAAAMIADLPRFRKGEAWVVPDSDWLDDGYEWEPMRVQFKLRDTFEIKPPKVGEVRREPKVLVDVDLAQLRAALSVEQPADEDESAVGGATQEAYAAMQRRAEAAERDWREAIAQRDTLADVVRRLAIAARASTRTVMAAVEVLITDLDAISDTLGAPTNVEPNNRDATTGPARAKAPRRRRDCGPTDISPGGWLERAGQSRTGA